MSQPQPLPHIAVLAFVGSVSSACASMPAAERAEPGSAHSFAVTHHAELEREIGGGGGPHVRTLATLAKCPNILDTARALTEQQDVVYPAPSAEVAADRLVAVLASNAELGCAAVSAEGSSPRVLQQRGEGRAKNAAERANMKEQFGE